MEIFSFEVLVRGVLSLSLASVVLWCLFKSLPSLHNPFTIPISRVNRYNTHEESTMPFFRGAFELYAAFFLLGIIFSFTSGALGNFQLFSGINVYTPEQRLLWGFMIGCYIAVVVRLCSLYLSNSFASHFQVLTMSFIGLVVYRYSFDYNQLTHISDFVLKTNLRANPLLPAFYILMPLIAMILTEGTNFLSKLNWKTNLVPHSLLYERIEQDSYAKQIFNPVEVEKTTNKCISSHIRKEGLFELCWIVNVLNEETLQIIHESTKEWIRSNYDSVDVEKKAEKIIRNSCRLIVTNKKSFERIESEKNSLIRRVKYFPEPTRNRTLIVNGTLALVYLPLPFKGEENEDSNCAFVISNLENTYKLRSEFYNIWYGHLQVANFKNFNKLLLESDQKVLLIADTIYRKRTPTSKPSVMQAFNISEDEATACLTKLLKMELIRKNESQAEETYLPRMFGKSCDISDMCSRHC